VTTVLFVHRFLADYARNGVNLLMLVLVPVVFVAVAAPSLADAAELFGGAGGPAVETATAGWAAAFLSGVAMYFQLSASRDTDRRLVIAGLPEGKLVAGRLVTGLLLAALASAAALLTLWLRTGIDDPARVATGTLMFAVIYGAIGAVVATVARNPVNGTVLILFVWLLDVFMGPTQSAVTAEQTITRFLPTHFVTLWMVDLPLRHGGRLSDLGWAIAWTVGAVFVAFVVVAQTARQSRRRHAGRVGSVTDQLFATTAQGIRDWSRNPVLWVLLVVVPSVFILLADAITPHGSTPIVLNQGGNLVTAILDPARIHAGTMVPIAIGTLSALAGLFLVLDARSGDRRLALAGMRTGPLVAARLTVVSLAALLAAAVSLGAAAFVFDARQWGVYAAANGMVALTYGLVGVILGPLFGRVSGVFVAFIAPFLDLGIGQSPMLRAEPGTWAHFLPGYGGNRILIDGGLTGGFDEYGALLIALAWLGGLVVVATMLFRPPRVAASHHVPGARRVGWRLMDNGALHRTFTALLVEPPSVERRLMREPKSRRW